MKYTLAIAALLVAAASSNAFAEGHVSHSQLAELGLPGMTVMTDAQGSEVRGQGFAFASSVSSSSIPGASTTSTGIAIFPNFAHSDSSTVAAGSFELSGGGFFATQFFGAGIFGGTISGNIAVGSAGSANAYGF